MHDIQFGDPTPLMEIPQDRHRYQWKLARAHMNPMTFDLDDAKRARTRMISAKN
ncbi:hypothetical protein QCA50_016925 [Cerrena zonata]|uniref:Uncharacterized protein n=1 Tax=Cerrena zonata TaxID=2478898 RepID=A0AAW0FK90_9APHY